MKVIISESKYEQGIIRYLDLNLVPDYGWATHQFYKDEVERYNDVEFFVNDESQYIYFLSSNRQQKSLVIYGNTSYNLINLFGYKWIPIFKNWFEQNTGLEVVDFVYYDENNNRILYQGS